MSRPRGAPPRVAEWLVRRVVAPGRTRDGLLGDLEEGFRARGGTPWRARAWYWREALSAVALHGADAFLRRHGTGGDGMEGWIRDGRHAIRVATRRPMFSALVVATLALGVGANAAVFALVHALLVEALPYEHGHRMVMADQESDGFRASVSIPNYEDWRDRSAVFDGFGLEAPTSVVLGDDDGARIVEARAVLGDFFTQLGIRPTAGSLPTADDLGPGAARIAVVTHEFWTSSMGARPDAVGSSLELNAESFEVVAVLPPAFALDRTVQLYVPMGLRADRAMWTDRSTSSGGVVVARLRPGADVDDARRDLARVTDDLRRELGADVPGAAVFGMRAWYLGDSARTAVLLLGGVLLVLLAACANVATFLLARAEERRVELAIRASVGASRGTLARQMVLEALVYGLVGGAAGVALGFGALTALVRTLGTMVPQAFLERVGPDPVAAAGVLAVSVLCTVGFGLVPALHASREPGRAPTVRALGAGPGGARLRGILVAGEVALSVVLLVATGLLLRSVANLESVDPGFVRDGVTVQRIRVDGTRYPGDQAAEVHARVRREVAALPGVRGVASSNLYPFSGTNWEMLFREPSTWPAERGESVLYTAATPEYFDVFGIEVVRGRAFSDADRADAPPVVLVDETAAARYWPGQDPIGRLVAVDDVPVDGEYVPLWRTVVGVVAHVRNYELAEPSRIEAYVPLAQSPACCTTLWLAARTDGDPADLVEPVRAIVRGVDPDIAVYRASTLRDVVDGQTVMHRAVRTLFAAFGVLALLLGAVGIYGVVATGAHRRRREIGLRVALGAAPGRAAGRVVAASMGWVVLGLVAGLAGGVWAGGLLDSLLVGVDPLEGEVLLGVVAALAVTAAAGAALPALRASRVDPAAVFREE